MKGSEILNLTIEIENEKLSNMSNKDILSYCETVINSYREENTRECELCHKKFLMIHGNQKHCPDCFKTIQINNRKKNRERYLHKVITDYINNYRRSEQGNSSKDFRDESNYYWAIVQDKTPKTERKNWYLDYIQTKDDYMEWLERKYAEIKNSKID